MYVEKRTYTLHPGTTQQYLKLYEQEGLAVQTRILPYEQVADMSIARDAVKLLG